MREECRGFLLNPFLQPSVFGKSTDNAEVRRYAMVPLRFWNCERRHTGEISVCL